MFPLRKSTQTIQILFFNFLFEWIILILCKKKLDHFEELPMGLILDGNSERVAHA